MAVRDPESDAVFRDVVAAHRDPAFEVKRMFGADGLMVDGRLACFVSGTGALVAKLPAHDADALRAAGLAEPMVMRGRPMREWFAVRRDPAADWFAIAESAIAFVRDPSRESTARNQGARPESGSTRGRGPEQGAAS